MRQQDLLWKFVSLNKAKMKNMSKCMEGVKNGKFVETHTKQKRVLYASNCVHSARSQ